MSIEVSAIEAQLLALERQTFHLRTRVADMDAAGRMSALEQSLAACWALGVIGGCTTTLQGRVRGVTGILPGATVTIQGPVSGTNYGTVTANASGLWSAAITIDSRDTTLHAFVGGFPPRLDTTHANVLSGFTTCAVNDWSTNSTLDIHLFGASGYGQFNLCNLPVNGTLNITDSFFGSGTAIYTGSFWQSCYQITTQGGGCPAVSTGLQFKLNPTTGAMSQAMFISIGTGCPVATTGCASVNTAVGPAWTRTSLTCPTTGAPGFSISFSGTVGSGNVVYPAGTYTITLSE